MYIASYVANCSYISIFMSHAGGVMRWALLINDNIATNNNVAMYM